MIQIGYDNNEKIISFLQEINNDFNPPLINKVILEDYVKKVREKAILLVDIENNEIAGILVFYCNDQLYQKGFATLCGVRKQYRRCGIARRLFEKAISHAAENGMKVLALYSNNPVAIKLYKDLGFQLLEDGERAYLELKL